MSTPYPGPRSVLVLDNARIHHSDEIEELVQGYGECLPTRLLLCIVPNSVCRLSIEYLLPYSPDYNPIEQAFSAIKSHLRRQGITFFSSTGLYYELYCACDIITPEMTWGFFSHAGYMV